MAPEFAQTPPQELSCQPLTVLLAVSVTTVPWGKLALHVVGQSIPAGLLVTFPFPLIVTDNEAVGGGGGGGPEVKIAVTDSFPLAANVHVGDGELVPCVVHAPL